MKKYFLFAGIVLGFFSQFSYAYSCREDVDEMYFQIKKYESIQSIDGHRFIEIANLPDQYKNVCMAYAYQPGQIHPEYVCKVKWVKGDWGATLSCV